MAEALGLKWLSDQIGIAPVQPFRVQSVLGPTRRTIHVDGLTQEVYPAQYQPDASIPGHLAFALKNEVIHLEFLARLFAAIDPAIIEHWIRGEPNGIYARRTGFFYEWLTDHLLDVPDAGGNYTEALPADRYLTASKPVNISRWRVRDNLPGNRNFCPIVYRTDKAAAAESYDCAKALQDLEVEYGANFLMRSAVWLSIKESRASFAIEHEQGHLDRIQRFASVMEQRCGAGPNPLYEEELTSLQISILGPATRYGLRESPVFVGHTTGYSEIVDYIGPHWDANENLLGGLREFLVRTMGRSPIARAAVASFGFVYIHPMVDGNGRISRFLVNDVLRRDGAIPAPYILPISATITDTSWAQAGYDRALELFSKPLLGAFRDRYHFGSEVTYADGVTSNFHFDAYTDALPAWKYPDLTGHVEYLGDVVKSTIEVEMSQEAKYLRNQELARAAVKNWLEGPNTDIDRIIRSVSQSGAWQVSGKLVREFPQLSDAQLAANVVSAIREVFEADQRSLDSPT